MEPEVFLFFLTNMELFRNIFVQRKRIVQKQVHLRYNEKDN